jgi:hypothetical protein
MPNEFEFRDYKSIEDYMKTLEGSKYYHALLLKAVNHPIRKEILNIISEAKRIPREELINKLGERNIVINEDVLNYNLDYLVKALCINVIDDESKKSILYEITQSGKVIDWI